MVVTLLESQKKDPSRVNLYIDGNFFCGISINTIAKYSLFAGKEITSEILDELFFSELEMRFFDKAVELLVKSPKTEKQVVQYLKELSFKKKGKWFDNIDSDTLQKICSKVIGKLQEYGYLNDREYAELFVNSRLKNRPRGKDILIMELISKGVSKDIAIDVTSTMISDEYELLVQAYKKKYKDQKINMDDRKKIDYLRRKGFEWDLIEKYINNESGK